MTDCQPKQHARCPIVDHRLVGHQTFLLTVESGTLADRFLPGQFVMVRLADSQDPLLGRALAIYDRRRSTTDRSGTLSVVYSVKGKFTQALSRLLPGQIVQLWGPLGNAFASDPVETLYLAAGGVGHTPMLSLMRQSLGLDRFGDASTPTTPWATRVVFCYGARSANGFSCLEDFSSLPIDLRLATEDGTQGTRGRVTDALTAAIQEYGTERSRIACCGPEPMMEAVAHLAAQHAIRCQVSLETPMACGIGICFTCVAKVGTPSDWDYRRTCIEGPVFEADQVVW